MKTIKVNKQEAISEIQSLLLEGNKVHELILSGEISSYNTSVSEWRESATKLLKNIFQDNNLVAEFE